MVRNIAGSTPRSKDIGINGTHGQIHRKLCSAPTIIPHRDCLAQKSMEKGLTGPKTLLLTQHGNDSH